MSVRLSCNTGQCGNRVTYGRTACTPVFEIKTGEINIVEVDFCDGCTPCNSNDIVSAIDPAVETVVLGSGGITASVKAVNGCVIQLLIDATNATPKTKYIVRQTVNMENCTRLSECFKVKITGECSASAPCPTSDEECNKFLGQEKLCGTTTQSLTPPAGTVYAVVHVSSDAMQYTLDGTTPTGAPAIYANIGDPINLGSYQEILGFRADPYCPGKEVAFVASYYGC